MGQYHQWLHYREIEQQLQAQMEALKKELLQLQAQYQEQHRPEVLSDESSNLILHALATSFSEQPPSLRSTTTYPGMPQTTQSTPSSEPGPPPQSAPAQARETMSPAFFGPSNLPNFGPQEIPSRAAPDSKPPSHPPVNQSLPPVPHSDMDLLPEDMSAFFDQHAPTEPQIELPHWLHNLATGTNGPVDQESLRNNRLVQRWVERWRRQPPGPINNRRESS